MPALRACCRKWEFGSDDLVFPFFGALIFRILCLIGILISVGYFRESYGCPESRLLVGFTFSVLTIIIVAIVVDFLVLVFSARGTIVRPRGRWPVKHLLHLRLLVFLVEILLLVVGTVIAIKPDIGGGGALLPSSSNATDLECLKTEQAITLIRIISGVDWAVLLVLALVTALYLDPLRCYSTRPDHKIRLVRADETDGASEQHWVREQNTWERRFKMACCITGRDDEHQVAYKEVAQLFADFFGDMSDVVPSDIAAGMALLQKQHLAGGGEGDGEGRHPMSVPADLQREEDAVPFERSLHYLKYALAVYTWSLYIYMNLRCGLCSLCEHLSLSPRNEGVVGDNRCGCNMAGARKVAEVDEEDIVYASFTNGIFHSPFLVLLDHEHRAVVVSIRGTLSMGDVLTDLVANPEPVQLPPPLSQYFVHKGMLRTSERIRDKLAEERILERALGECPGYNLVIVGHSLGAGCAAILGLLLRSSYPDLHCYCYSPPGTVVDDQGAAYTESFVTSVTLGHDLVSHSSVHTFDTLKKDLVRAIERSRKPKYRIFLEGGLETTCWCFGRQVVLGHEATNRRVVTKNKDDQTGSSEEEEEKEEEDGILPIISRDLGSVKAEGSKEVLFVPGKIIHLADVGDSRGCCSSKRTLEPHWAHRSRFKRIAVTPGMIRDHFPDVLSAAMHQVWEERGGANHREPGGGAHGPGAEVDIDIAVIHAETSTFY